MELPKEKFTENIPQTPIEPSVKDVILRMCDDRDRKIREIVRKALRAVCQRYIDADGKISDEDLY